MALRRITDVHEQTASERVYEQRYRFRPGDSGGAPWTSPWISEKNYRRATKLQSSKPVSLGTILTGKNTSHNTLVKGKTLWWYKDRFYVDDHDDSLGQESRDTADGLTKLSGVNARVEQRSPGKQTKRSVPWWRKITGAREDMPEDSLPREEGRYFFAIGASDRNPRRTPSISQNEYHQAMKLQSSRAVAVGTFIAGKKTWYRIPLRGKVLWWYKDEFYLGEDYAIGNPIGKTRDEGTMGLRGLPGVRPESTEDSSFHYEERYCFAIGTEWGAPKTSPLIPRKDYARAKKLQPSEPVSLGRIEDGRHRGSTLWWHKDEFYVEKDGYSSEQVHLLLWEREQKQTRKFARLRKEMLSDHAIQQARRERIPEDVRIFVWKRDEGRCVQCGSQENLEFDHIVPVSKGGSNTARNIQLLCETCNRRKSDRI